MDYVLDATARTTTSVDVQDYVASVFVHNSFIISMSSTLHLSQNVIHQRPTEMTLGSGIGPLVQVTQLNMLLSILLDLLSWNEQSWLEWHLRFWIRADCEGIEIKLYILGKLYFNYLLRPAFWDSEYMTRPICKEYKSLTWTSPSQYDENVSVYFILFIYLTKMSLSEE